jgi:ubiquinone/menaquinone biosynthesis C-methylase UbiE
MDEKRHWDDVYGKNAPDRVSWYRPHLERSLRFIEEARIPKNAAIIDVGGGTSTLMDDLLDRGFSNLTVLDISSKAIVAAQERLGSRAGSVTWIVADITSVSLPEHHYDFWHDRAVFHFLTDGDERRRYVAAARRAVRPGGHIVVATFGPSGPEQCSGLEVRRYRPEEIHAEFGPTFQKIGSSSEVHKTPWGNEQEFVYCYCRLSAPSP